MNSFCMMSTGKRLRSVALVAVIAFSLAQLATSIADDCSSSNDDLYSLDTKYGHFMYRDNIITTWPRNPMTGELIEGGRVRYHLNSIMEVPIQNVSGTPVCQKFQSFSFSSNYPSQWASLPRKELNFTDSQSTCTRERKTISIAPNVTADAIVVTIRSTTDASAVFNVTFALPNSTTPVTTRSFDPQFTTANRSLSYSYFPETIKLTFELSDWTWQFEPGWSEMILYVVMENNLKEVEKPMPMSWDFTQMNMSMSMGMELTEKAAMMIEVVHDLSAVLDGVPFVLNPTGTETETTQPGIIDQPAILSSVQFAYLWLPFCSTAVGLVGRRFNHLWYDPSIAVLLNGELLSPDATPAEKKDKTKFIILAVCLVAAVVLIIGIFLLVWFKSSALKTFFRPYRKRKLHAVSDNKEAVNGVSAERDSRWSTASKPEFDD